MLALLKLTQILPTLLIGMILVGAVAGESAVWGTGLILLILDAVINSIPLFSVRNAGFGLKRCTQAIYEEIWSNGVGSS